MSEKIYANINADRTLDKDRRNRRNRTPQHAGSVSVKIRSYRAAVVCLVLLCVLLLTTVIVLCVYIHTKYTRERDELLTNINKLTKERNELLTNITNLTEERDRILIKYMNITNERDGLLIKNYNLTKQTGQFNQLQKILNETDGWLYSNFSFYFISSKKKSWIESRSYCMERGADLIIINNREKQEFAKKFSHGNEFWIGLTDSDEKGSWKWVDGSTLTSSFWRSEKRYGNSGENCVVSFSSGWYDHPCDKTFRWICEKKIFSN